MGSLRSNVIAFDDGPLLRDATAIASLLLDSQSRAPARLAGASGTPYRRRSCTGVASLAR